MQNTVVVHVQSFAVFARPIAVAVVDISITTQGTQQTRTRDFTRRSDEIPD